MYSQGPRLLFILPSDNTYRYHGCFSRPISYAPLTLAVLAALVPPELGAAMTIVDEGVQRPLTQGKFDIVAITCVTSSAYRAYELCRYWRQKGSYVVLGGPHPSLMPQEAALYADSVFVGLAEETFPRFVQDYLNGTPQKLYRHCPPCGHLAMPAPRRDLISKRYMNIPTVIANRGCRNNCNFCSISQISGKQGITRPVGEVIAEIKALNNQRVILLDPSPTSDESYAEEFFRALLPLNLKWSGLSTLDIVGKVHLFDLMVRSGCEGILVGFESINAESLAAANKCTNRVADYRYAVHQFHQADIPVLGCFMVGFDADTRASLKETIQVIDEIGIDLPRFSMVTPFPGTPLFDLYETSGRLLTKDWSLYDTMQVVFQPRHFAPAGLTAVFHELWAEAYTVKRILKRIGNIRREKIIKLAANLGFKYYAHKLQKAVR